MHARTHTHTHTHAHTHTHTHTHTQEKQQADAALKAKLGTAQEEIAELRKKYERSRGDLKQRTVDVHMLQVRRMYATRLEYIQHA